MLSGSHLELVPEVLAGMRAAGLDDVPRRRRRHHSRRPTRRSLVAQGVAAVFTPKDYGLTEIMGRIVEQIRAARGLAPLQG